MRAFTTHTGTMAPLLRDDVDTDQIIPVRFCTRTTRTGYEDGLFADWRHNPDFVLERPQHQGASILVTGRDFGTGSSREFAVWALRDYGFRVVIATRFGDIFRGNALKTGLLAILAEEEVVHRLWDLADTDPTTELTVDLEARTLTVGDWSTTFDLDDHNRWRLLNGLDDIAVTATHFDDIRAYEQRRNPALPTTSRHG